MPLPRGLWSHWHYPGNAISPTWRVDLSACPALWGLSWRWHYPLGLIRGKDTSCLPSVSLLGWAVQRNAYDIVIQALEHMGQFAPDAPRIRAQLTAPCAAIWEPDHTLQRTPAGWLASELVRVWSHSDGAERWGKTVTAWAGEEVVAAKALLRATPLPELIGPQPDGSPSVSERLRPWANTPSVRSAFPVLAAHWTGTDMDAALSPSSSPSPFARL